MEKESNPESIRFCLIVTSDHVYRRLKEDKITPMLREILGHHGYRLKENKVVPNSPELIAEAVLNYASRCDIIVVTGGTGPSRRDVSLDTVKVIAEKEMVGFGELFRYLTYIEEGTKTWLSRASAFIVRGRLVIVVPGSPTASRLALEKIIFPEMNHIVKELSK